MTAPLVAALRLAIPELEAKRRRDFAAGEHAYQAGVRTELKYAPNDRKL